MVSGIGAVLVATALALAPGTTQAAEGDDGALAPLVIEMADTPKVHKALARHYRDEAQEARAEERRHERMADSYRSRKVSLRWIEERRHCERLSQKYAEVAAEYEALSQLHEEEAMETR